MRRRRRPAAPRALGERAFHRWLARTLPASRRGRLPLGDDAADLDPPRGTVAVVTTDSLVEGTHFFRRSPGRSVGRAASGVSLSDLASKGAKPGGILLAIVLPRGSPEAWARSVVLGAEEAAARFGAHVVGGDTKAGRTRTVVSTAVGWAPPARLPSRRGARPRDRVVTTGWVGRGGLRSRGVSARSSVRRLRAMLDVEPRVKEGTALARFAHAMLDTSDGIGEASRLLARASGVRVVLEDRRLPYVAGLRTRPRRPRYSSGDPAFYGGDYELLATVPRRRLPAAARAVRAAGGRLTEVGWVEKGEGAYLRTARGILPMPAAGWQPLPSPDA